MAEDQGERVLVSFVCQRCSHPLKLDDSLSSFSEHISAELNLPIHSNPDVDLESQAASFNHYIPPLRLDDSGNGFMLVSDAKEAYILSQTFKRKAALFDTLSGNSNIDHPLCDECTDYLIEILEQELRDTQDDYDDYFRYYMILQSDTSEPKLSELQKELDDLKAEGNRFLEELEALKKEEIELKRDILEQEQQAQSLEKQREIYFRQYIKHQKSHHQAVEDAMSVESQLKSTQMHLDKLKKTNVFNATFHIWHKGHFGTINNFSLGRLPSAPVDWSEINAAWGQVALLLSALARKINLTFERYRIVPCGNHSYLESVDEQKEYPLYGSGGFKFLWDTKFDIGMASFLDCLQQFQDRVKKLEKGNKTFCFPYRASKGKIEDNEGSYSVKTQLNSEEQWTKAMKFMLTNLKWGLAWISSQLSIEEAPQT